jgi:hypothetical protein
LPFVDALHLAAVRHYGRQRPHLLEKELSLRPSRCAARLSAATLSPPTFWYFLSVNAPLACFPEMLPQLAR